MNRAIRRVGGAVVVLVLILIGQLTYLQIIDADDLENDPRNVRSALRDINRPRGPIVTADGVVVAESKKSDDGTEFEFQRGYPTGGLFAQVVGYQSFVFGSTGVERSYNDELVGRGIALEDLEDILNGEDATGTVELSLRNDLQQAAAEALGDQRGSVVAIEPKTGKVLAMYSNPGYDPNPLAGHDTKAVQEYFNALESDPSKPALARAYRERYPPGSTFKVITASVALETGTATPDTDFPVLRSLDLPQTDATLSNFGGSSCGGTLAVSFRRSCNTTFGALGLQMGENFIPGMEAFGINTAPPIDLVPTAVPSLGPLAGSFQNDQPRFALAGIGQGDVATSPLEMALVAAGIANGGVIMEPHVVGRILTKDGDVLDEIDPEEWRTATNPATAQAVAAMMVTVVEAGTGTAAQIDGVTVAGKTGTAQTEGGVVHAWFVSFAPAEDPQIAVAVIVEGGGSAGSEATGGEVAAPIAARLLRIALGKG